MEGTKTAATALHTRLDEFGQELVGQKQRIDAAITSFTQTFNDAETSRASDFSRQKDEFFTDFNQRKSDWEASINTAIAEARNKFETLSAKGEQDFSAGLSTLIGQGNELIGKFRGDFEALSAKGEKDFEAAISLQMTQGNELMEKLKADKDEAERLVGIISMTGMVGGYQKVANQEQSAFKFWRWITLGSMVVLCSFALYAFINATSTEFQAGAFANRIFVTVTLAVLAGYCAFQADRHRRAETINRRMELELASFDPFLATLKDDERNELKKQIADRVFGHFGSDRATPEAASPANLVEIVTQLISKLPIPKI